MSKNIHETACVNETAKIGENTRIWQYVLIMDGCEIGKDCNICSHASLDSNVKMGDRCTVKNGAMLYDGVVAGNDVFFGPGCCVTNESRPKNTNKTTKEGFVTTNIGNGATIGAKAVVVCGNHIGEYATVGAGAVVIKPVESYSVVVGNPARPIGYICNCRIKFSTKEELDKHFCEFKK